MVGRDILDVSAMVEHGVEFGAEEAQAFSEAFSAVQKLGMPIALALFGRVCSSMLERSGPQDLPQVRVLAKKETPPVPKLHWFSTPRVQTTMGYTVGVDDYCPPKKMVCTKKDIRQDLFLAGVASASLKLYTNSVL